MYQKVISVKSIGVLKTLLAVNFNASLIFLVLVSVMSVLGSGVFFEDQTDLYGPMMGNLRLMLIYLCFTEIAVYSFCKFKNNYQGIMLLGAFLIILMVSIEFYGYINQVPIDENYGWFFLYLGLSHIFFAGLQPADKD